MEAWRIVSALILWLDEHASFAVKRERQTKNSTGNLFRRGTMTIQDSSLLSKPRCSALRLAVTTSLFSMMPMHLFDGSDGVHTPAHRYIQRASAVADGGGALGMNVSNTAKVASV